MKIGLTGASGKLGRETTRFLLDIVEPERLVLITRDVASLRALADRGVSVRAGDFTKPETLAGAMRGIDRLLLISAHDLGERVAQHSAAIDAARAVGVRHLIYTSWANPDSEQTRIVAADHAATEHILRGSGLDWTILRHSPYADVYGVIARQAAETGVFIHNHGDGVVAPVSRQDCGRVAAHVLASNGHVGENYVVSGPDLLSAKDIAVAAASAFARPVEAINLDDEAYIRRASELYGWPPLSVMGIAMGGRGIRMSELAQRSTAVKDITGNSPISFVNLLRQGTLEW